jgi:glutathione reductase (NADPH)
MPKKTYDLVVVGTGAAALGSVTAVRNAGWSVAVVDFRSYGGTCALRGCDPKKMLVTGAETVDLVRRMQSNGVAGETHIDWPALMAFKRRYTDPIPAGTEEYLRKAGIDTLHGHARFVASNCMEVDGSAIEGRHFLLASGAEPVNLDIPGEQHVVTSEEFLGLEQLPHRILLVGGGYIAAEFSHIAARAGAKVTILQRAERMLTHFDPDLVDLLMETFRTIGIDVRTHTTVEAVEKTDNGFSVRASERGKSAQFEADLVVHAAGRKPDLRALNLGAANVTVKDGKLELNEYLQSVSNLAVYAAGDAAQKGPPLTPVSSHDAEVVTENLLHGSRRKPDYTGVPSVAFTIPPIAAVGMTDAEARKHGVQFRTNYKRVPDWYTAVRVAEPVYGFKTLVEEKTARILGAHLVGPHVDEVINVLALAIRNGLTAEDLKNAIFAYPTGASDISSML